MATKAKKRATPKAGGIDLQPKTFKAAKEVIQQLGREVLDGRAKLQNFVVEHEEAFSESNRLRARNAELVEQITSVNKGSELLTEKISKYVTQIKGWEDIYFNSARKASENYGLHTSEIEKLRKANEYASKRLAAYEAEFGFLPDELGEVEPLAAFTGLWSDFWVTTDLTFGLQNEINRTINEQIDAQPKPTHNDNSERNEQHAE